MKTCERVDSDVAANVLELGWKMQKSVGRSHSDEEGMTRAERRKSLAEPTLQRLFNELAYGLIVIDAARQVSHINRAARGILAREQRLRVHGRTLKAWHERDARSFDVAISKAFQGKRNIMRIGEAQGSIMLVPLSVAATPDAPTSEMNTRSVRQIALVFERSACSESLAIALYAQSHGLTSGEERVLRALSDNQSIDEAANALSSAVSTVRTHVIHIREKTGARSLRAMVSSLKSIPPLMPAFGD